MDEFGRHRLTQTAVAPAPFRALRHAWDHSRWAVVIPLALIVVYAFMPSLANGFVSWDDYENLVENPYFRGLDTAQVEWAWTTFWLGVYQPFAWLLFETQFELFELDPRGYHLTSLLLQVACAAVLYRLTVALLIRCQSASCLESPWVLSLSAGLATALFAVHPLRVEAVAWASCQPYLPCILFSMLAVLAYLRAVASDSSCKRVWLIGAYVLFATALLFKAVAVSLPAVLLILDVYPLGRIPDKTARWFGRSTRRALLEKVPFVVTSLLFMRLAIEAKPQSRFPGEHYGTLEGVSQACYGIWFYIYKMALPVNLVAVYPSPREFHWLAPLFSVSILATFATTAGLFLVRRRWPGLLAVWLSYLVILAPNSGIIRISNQIAADRYSYMSMLGSVVLAAASFCWIWRTSSRWRRGARIVLVAIGLGALLGLTFLTRSQCRTWLDSETLWAHALAHGPDSNYMAHNNLGAALHSRSDFGAAAAHYIEALQLKPDYVDAHNNLGTLLSRYGNYAEAEAHFAEALRHRPAYVDAHFNLGLALDRQGKYKEAAAHLLEALRLSPGFVDAHYNLGVALYRLGNYEAASAHYAEAIRLKPDFALAYNAMATIMATCPEARFRDGKRAVEFATRACELTQWKSPPNLHTLAAALAEAGDFQAAVLAQTKTLDLLTGERQKDECRSRLALYRAKRPYHEVSSGAERKGSQ